MVLEYTPSGRPFLSHSSHFCKKQFSPFDIDYKGNWPWDYKNWYPIRILTNHSYWCGLAAMFAPEAKKKKTHHITKRKHLRIEDNCKYLG